MSTGVSIGVSPTEAAQRLLEDFVIDNAELEQLELKLRRFNLFEALKLVRYEIRHSDFLAYLLDPEQNHGVSDRFLKVFLQSALKGSANQTVTPIDIDTWDLSSAEVRREWQNIDIFIRVESRHLAVIIENKVESAEQLNQLKKYYESVAEDCNGWNIVAIFLTKDGHSPKNDERYIPLGYDHVGTAIERLLSLNGHALDKGVHTVIEHYAEMLRRHIMTESAISELCQRIYRKHKEALDLIYEHRPDRQQLVRECLEEWISKSENPKLNPDHSTKAYIRFIPDELDIEPLKQGPGTWTPKKRILLFEAVNLASDLTVKLTIGPGPAEIRQKLFNLALAAKPVLKPSSPKLYPQWSQIFSRRLLSPKSYELSEAEFVEELQAQWFQFVKKDLLSIVEAIKKVWAIQPLT